MNYYQHNYQNYTEKSTTQVFFQQKQMKDYTYKNYIQELKNREIEFIRNQKCSTRTKEPILPDNQQDYDLRRDGNAGSVQKNQFQQTSNDYFRKRVEDDNKTQSFVGRVSSGNGLSDGEDTKYPG